MDNTESGEYKFHSYTAEEISRTNGINTERAQAEHEATVTTKSTVDQLKEVAIEFATGMTKPKRKRKEWVYKTDYDKLKDHNKVLTKAAIYGWLAFIIQGVVFYFLRN